MSTLTVLAPISPRGVVVKKECGFTLKDLLNFKEKTDTFHFLKCFKTPDGPNTSVDQI